MPLVSLEQEETMELMVLIAYPEHLENLAMMAKVIQTALLLDTVY